VRDKLTPNRLWFSIFGVWFILLSGLLAHWGGSPGVLQAFRLSSLLSVKQQKVQELEAEVAQLEEESTRLEKSRVAQEREIRRTLGYAAQDELIFDFSSATRAKTDQ
jgi:cell division protein FtsB